VATGSNFFSLQGVSTSNKEQNPTDLSQHHIRKKICSESVKPKTVFSIWNLIHINEQVVNNNLLREKKLEPVAT
jgi:hypothetical protein